MKRQAVLRVATLALACVATAARAADWEMDLDVRLLTSDGQKSFLDGGSGALRFGQAQSGLQWGRLRLALNQTLGELWSLHLDASSYGDDDKNPIDLTEAYLQFRPYPFDGWRLRVKAGAFYAPISLENRASGWESPYTLSSSAINSWVGEELRTIGVEGQLDWLGTRLGHAFDVGLTGAVFGWNDPAGVALADGGFMIDDRQSTLFGRIGRPGGGPFPPLEVFHEIDGRPGAYVGLEARYLDRVVVRALHYDNRADPGDREPALHEFAWATHFNSVGARVETAQGWTGIAQWLNGCTTVAPGGMRFEFPFDAKFLLLSKRTGVHTLSVRYDKFQVLQDSYGGDAGDASDAGQRGHAWTVAYVFEPNAHWKLTLEWLSVTTDSSAREEYFHTQGLVAEHKLEAAFRYALGSGVR